MRNLYWLYLTAPGIPLMPGFMAIAYFVLGNAVDLNDFASYANVVAYA